MTTAAREYRTVDKSAWGDGPWQNEPDKMQWVDEVTGLDCLIVRNPGGALCGYVGVGPTHSLHGIGYSDCSRNPKCEESWCGHGPDNLVTVHGGLTFSDECADPSRENYDRWMAQWPEVEAEARRHPKGDIAERLRTLGHLRGDFPAWVRWMESVAVCHVALDGRPDKVWWLGFDCAHSGDITPKWRAQFEDLSSFRHGVYRDVGYVKDQVRQLAGQLAAVA